MNEFTKIEIWWHGPFTLEEIKKEHDPAKSFGLYQIYGTHSIFGSNSLLYIGKASEQTFAKRLEQHDWANWEASAAEFYIGRLGGVSPIENTRWTELIDFAERLLIYFCAPPYNTQYLNGYGNVTNVVVLNFDKKNMLPFEVSTLYDNSEFWNENGVWKEFTTDILK